MSMMPVLGLIVLSLLVTVGLEILYEHLFGVRAGHIYTKINAPKNTVMVAEVKERIVYFYVISDDDEQFVDRELALNTFYHSYMKV